MNRVPGKDERPDWWIANQQLKAELGLPPYEPPRFSDDVYTHEVVEPIEQTFDCHILFRGVNVSYGDDWTIWVDEVCVATVGRHRDNKGNTVYEMASDECRDILLDVLEPQAESSQV